MATDRQPHDLKKCSALFILTMKEKFKLTQTAIDVALGQIQSIVTYALEDTKTNLQQAIATPVSDQPMLASDLLKYFDISLNPFEGLHSEYMQNKFYEEEFHLVV